MSLLTDASINNLKLTKFGNTVVNRSIFKYGGGSAFFDGSGDFLQATISDAIWNIGVGNQPFTIEFWVYRLTGGTQVFCSKHGGTNAWNGTSGLNFNFYYTGTILYFEFWGGSSAQSIGNTVSIPTGQWVHLASAYDGTTTRIFVNGVLQGTTSNANYGTTTSANTFEVGAQINGTFPTNGYIDDLRVTKGVARYTTNFTPPTAQLPNNSAEDPHYNNVVLLLNFNPMVDSSTNNFNPTEVGDTKVDLQVKKFGNGAGYFDGSGDYLQIPLSDAFNFGQGPFTIEMWVNPDTTQVAGSGGGGNAGAFLSTRITSIYSPLEFSIKDDLKIQLLVQTSGPSWQGPFISNTSLTANIWSHIALVFDGTVTRLFINGVLNGNFSITYRNQNSIIYIGKGGDGNFNGYIDDLRITNGVARYTANFIPPTAEFQDPSDPEIENVSLLLKADGTSGSTIFRDMSKNNHIITTVGNTVINTSIKKFGTGSASFDGSGDYLELPLNSQFDFGSGDFTIECWFYTTKTGFQTIAARWGIGGNAFFLGTDTSTPNLQIYINNILACIGGAVQINRWNHAAVSRNGSEIKLFLNGTQAGSTYNIGNTAIISSTEPLRLGDDNNSGNPGLQGYIDELRITKGVSRYNSNFIPHTAPFRSYLLTPFSTSTLSQNLLAFWKLSDLKDSSNNRNNLTDTGNVQFVTGKIGNCAQFNGSNTLVANSLTPTFNAGQPFSVAFWALPTSNVLGTLVGAQGSNTFNIHNNSNGSMSFNNAASADVSIAGAFEPGIWKHYVCIVSGGRNKVYINGILVYNQASAATYSATSTTIGIGRYPGGTTLPFQGLIDSVGIWQKELTQSEVNELYNSGIGLEP